MRDLIIMRGIPGCGKSTWIKKQFECIGTESYVLSSDDIRLLVSSKELLDDGNWAISQDNNEQVWSILYAALEIRMKNGDLTVVDATNLTARDLNRYKELARKYRYHVYCIDFSNYVSLEECLERNKHRGFRKVPEKIIISMYEKMMKEKIPSGITVLDPSTKLIDLNYVLDLSEYKNIVHIGDIHGCYSALKEYFDRYPFSDENYYIFCGDYIDRGIENYETLQFLSQIYNKPNVCLLEGNHERNLNRYGHDEAGDSKEFNEVTRVELESKGFSKVEARKIYRKLRQCIKYTYGMYSNFVCHGGISDIRGNQHQLIATKTLIKGTGKTYNDIVNTELCWHKGHTIYEVMIHGHRNPLDEPISPYNNVKNLEGKIEFGGNLRVTVLNQNGFEDIEIENKVYRITEKMLSKDMQFREYSNAEMVDSLRHNPFIKEKVFRNGKISSFNFTKEAFYRKHWSDQTVTARGLFINDQNEIVCRGYQKFFNLGENEMSSSEHIKNEYEFPANVYLKENGFLAMISYDKDNDDYLIASKSTIDGEYTGYIKEVFEKYKSKELLSFIKEQNVTFIFECEDPKNDPHHIVKYDEQRMVLLDVVKNKFSFEPYYWDKLLVISEKFNLPLKTLYKKVNNYDELINLFKESDQKEIEGFVVVNNKNEMFKYKTVWYRFWKILRSYYDTLIKCFSSKKLYEEYYYDFTERAWLPDFYLNNEEVMICLQANSISSKFHKWLLTNNKLNEDFNIIKLREEFYG